MPRADLYNVLPRHVLPKESFMRRRTPLVIVTLLVVLVAGVVGSLQARAAETFKPYPLPKQCQHRACDYIPDDRCEIDDPDVTLPDGTTLDRYRMLIGYPRININRHGQVHIRDFEFLGYSEAGEYAFDRVEVYVRIPGTKANKSQRVTPVYRFDPADRKGGMYIGRDNGRTVRGLEVVFTGYDRGESCSVTVSPWDVPWAVRGAV